MTTSEKEAMHQSELHKKLWDMANNLRGQMRPMSLKTIFGSHFLSIPV